MAPYQTATTNLAHANEKGNGVAGGQVPVNNDQNAEIGVQFPNLAINGFISSTGVANFLNIPYARIPARFRQAVPIDLQDERGVIDATQYGPCCPQPLDVLHFTTSHLNPAMINVEHCAEFSCLSLNVYAPATAVSSDKKLPVLVWIHGGGWTHGDGGSEYDGNYIVQYSIAIGKPVIVVTFNYRLGYYGFLSSKEIKEEARRHGETGYANLGFHDQRLALQWVQKNICFFGGDGQEITASGESAGAFALLIHLRSKYPAFQRAFILSAPIMQPAEESTAQATFDRLVTRTGLSPNAPASIKLDALRSWTPIEMKESLGGGNASPIWDTEWFANPDPQSFQQNIEPFPSWVKGIVIGSTKEETALFCSHLAKLSGAEHLEVLKQAFGTGELLGEILSAFEIKESDSTTTGQSTLDALLQSTSEGVFGSVARTVASTQSDVPVSWYSFEQPDTFEESGVLKDRSYHSLGNSMFFRLPTVNLPDAKTANSISMTRTSDAMCEAAITLAYGTQPWEPFAQSQKVMVFNGEKTGLVLQADRKPQWAHLVSSPEKLIQFMIGCATLVVGGMRHQS